MTEALHEIALGAFHSRQRRAAKLKAAGEMTAEQAEADVRPWAAMACRLGAEIRELQELIDGIVVLVGEPLTGMQRRAIVADDLCTRQQLVEALQSARDAAIARAERTKKPEHVDAARKLMRLATHFAWDVGGKFFVRPYAWPAGLAYPPPRYDGPAPQVELAA